MKRNTYLHGFLIFSGLIFFFSSCLKDECLNTYKLYSPIVKSVSQIRAEMQSESPRPIENTGKIYLYGKYLLINEPGKGIHVFDNSDPGSPKNISFINIAGNMDMAVRNNFLYADSYLDLVVMDISDPTHASVRKIIDQVFMENTYAVFNQNNTTNPDSVFMIIGFNTKDTMVECSVYDSWNSCWSCPVMMDAQGAAYYSSSYRTVTGIGGSMARFTIMDDFMYTVNRSELLTFDLTTGDDPSLLGKNTLGNWGVETIFPFNDKLFIGTNNGMLLYDVSRPESPVSMGSFWHASSCDPVISDGQYAYVTLRSGTTCQGYSNQLDVLDITNLVQPKLLKTYDMHNPHGLAKMDEYLLICDGDAGLKAYDATDPNNLRLKKKIDIDGAYDIIVTGKLALVISKEGLLQYDCSDINGIHLLSRIQTQN